MMSPDGLRIGVIMNAERMTIEAVNRALKTLEEPTEQVRVILTSSRPLLLPATIRGRCLRWGVKPPAKELVLSWLRDTLKNTGQAPETEEQLSQWAMRLRHSPGLLAREIEDSSDHRSGVLGDIHQLLTAAKPQEITRAAANLARVHKAKVPEILSAVEWELNRINRQDLTQSAHRGQSETEAFKRSNRRRLIREIRQQAILGKVTLNAQLVAESIGLCGWEN
jgi:DNA polymerase III delta prime subunit